MNYYKNIDAFLTQTYFGGLDVSSDSIKEEANKIILKFNIHDLRNKSKILVNFVKYKVGDWLNRIELSEMEKVGSLNRFIVLYGKDVGVELYNFSNIKRKNKQAETHFKSVDHFLSQKPFKELKSGLTEESFIQVKKIIESFDKKYILNNKKEVIQNMLKYNVEGDWVKRLNDGDLFKRDGSSFESLSAKYGDRVANVLYNERKDKVKVTKEKFTETHSEEEWDRLCQRKRSNLGLQGYIEKYGEIEGTKKWNSYYSKWKTNVDINTQRGNRKNGQTLEEFQDRYGIDAGYKLWKKRIDGRKYTLSLDGFIEKFGADIGKDMREKYCLSNNKTSLKSFISRYGEKEGTIRYVSMKEKLIKYLKNSPCYSKMSQKLFESVYQEIKYKEDVKYALRNDEAYFLINENFCIGMSVDFKCGNSIIEFYGDYWHANPRKYNSDSILHHPNNHICANDIWELDKKKVDWLLKRGYSVKIVWEYDYLHNEKQTVDECIKFINENYEKKN